MVPLRQQLTELFTKYPVDLSRRMKFEQEIIQSFKKSSSLSIPFTIEQRAIYEQQLLRSIYFQLKKDHLILRRTADNQNTYYLGNQDEFNHKTNEYMEDALCYEMIGIINENKSEEQYLNEIIHTINSTLEELQRKKLIDKDHLSKISAIGIGKRTNINLPHLYFLPDTSSVSIESFVFCFFLL
jgi:hypothetical protein